MLGISCLIAFQLSRALEAAPPEARADALIRRLPPLCETADGATRRYRSRNFLLHTDLPDAQAIDQLTRMESVLRFAEQYWRKPCPGVIECYVAKDVSRWLDGELPDQSARLSIEHIGGATISIPSRNRRSGPTRAVFCARADQQIAEHETIHAYCLQTFGTTGPTWYNEGMAEVARHRRGDDRGVVCPADYVDFFRKSEHRSIRDIVAQGNSTAQISRSLKNAAERPADDAQAATDVLMAWREEDDESIRSALQWYRWNWSLCYFLSHNPNHAGQFQKLGREFLTQPSSQTKTTLRRQFTQGIDRAEFEYRFFMQRFGIGYRVDLCSWDWRTRPRTLEESQSTLVQVSASRGYQSTAVALAAGTQYDYLSRGAWDVGPDSPPTDAAGSANGQGRLIGVVYQGAQLSEPFDLGTGGSFTAPASGHLFVRCQDHWTDLANNSGRIELTISLQ